MQRIGRLASVVCISLLVACGDDDPGGGPNRPGGDPAPDGASFDGGDPHNDLDGGDFAGDGDSGGEPAVNHAPSATIDGQTDSLATVTRGGSVRIQGEASDPDGDALTLDWTVWSLSAPTVDCSIDFSVNSPTPEELVLLAPTTATNPDCDGDALVVFTVDDGESQAAAYLTLLVNQELSLRFFTDLRDISAGGSTTVTAVSSPDSAKTYDWQVVGASSGCDTADVTIALPDSGTADTNTSTRRKLTAALDPAVAGCAFTVEATAMAGGETASATMLIAVDNTAPTIEVLEALGFGISDVVVTPRVIVPSGATPTLVSQACDADGQALTQTWTGDLTALDCDPDCGDGPTQPPLNCTGYSVTFASPIFPGTTYSFTVTADDGAATSYQNILVYAEDCLWADAASAASVPDGTLAAPYATVGAALDAARRLMGTNVCVVDGNYAEDLVIPASDFNALNDHHPSLFGGYDVFGNSGGPPATVEASSAVGTTFASGYQGAVRHMTFTHAAGSTVSGEAAALTVAGASPILDGILVRGGAGDPRIGLDVIADGNTPFVSRSVIVGSSDASVVDAIGLRIAGGDSTEYGAGVYRNSIYAGSGTGVGIGVLAEAGTHPQIIGNDRITACTSASSCGFSVGVGIDVRGSVAEPVGGRISLNSMIDAGGPVTEASYGIRLRHASGLVIGSNPSIGSPLTGGARIAHGIADGGVAVDGTVTPSGSVALTIAGNGVIHGGSQLFMGACTGSRMVSGILLAGTGAGSVVRDNAEVRGGVAAMEFDPATMQPRPAVAAGIWTVDTDGVEIVGNGVFPGGQWIDTLGTCPPMPQPPAQAAIQDGIAGADAGSRGLTIRGNAAVCRPAQGSGLTSGFLTACAALFLERPQSVVVQDNVLASVGMLDGMGVWMRGGSGVQLLHNTIEIDYVVLGAPAQLNSVAKRAVRLTGIDEDGVLLANNILALRRDDPYDDPSERWAISETNDSSGSRIGTLVGNLFALEGDFLGSTDAPGFVRLRDENGLQSFAADDISAVPGVPTQNDNLVEVAGLTDPGLAKERLRLTPSSGAIDACDLNYVTGTDIDGQGRPTDGTCDIGADEL